jgi:glycosyltransferase involved in cell wall biosynthesis
LLAYRTEGTIVEALEAAPAQTEPCEIIVSNDASGECAVELAKKARGNLCGAHMIIVRHNAVNQGLCRHIETLAQIATGNIIVFMAGDDVSNPN